jgi:N utilization substance protein B
MKSRSDPRHLRRREAVKELFANSYQKQTTHGLAGEVLEHADEYDGLIAKAAPAWPIDKLNRIDLAILRLATHEIMTTGTPPKVIIDEAVELAKEFGGENSPSFVNGVLGNILTQCEKKEE